MAYLELRIWPTVRLRSPKLLLLLQFSAVLLLLLAHVSVSDRTVFCPNLRTVPDIFAGEHRRNDEQL